MKIKLNKNAFGRIYTSHKHWRVVVSTAFLCGIYLLASAGVPRLLEPTATSLINNLPEQVEIARGESRFIDLGDFPRLVGRLGFQLSYIDPVTNKELDLIALSRAKRASDKSNLSVVAENEENIFLIGGDNNSSIFAFSKSSGRLLRISRPIATERKLGVVLNRLTAQQQIERRRRGRRFVLRTVPDAFPINEDNIPIVAQMLRSEEGYQLSLQLNSDLIELGNLEEENKLTLRAHRRVPIRKRRRLVVRPAERNRNVLAEKQFTLIITDFPKEEQTPPRNPDPPLPDQPDQPEQPNAPETPAPTPTTTPTVPPEPLSCTLTASPSSVTSPDQEVTLTMTTTGTVTNATLDSTTIDPNGGTKIVTQPQIPFADFSGQIQDSDNNQATCTVRVARATDAETDQDVVANNPNAVIDMTVPTSFGDATKFLYTGPNPIQEGVAENTIKITEAGVISGLVLQEDGTPFPNAVVRVKDHPEYGETRTRDNGFFDLAVNAGGVLSVVIEQEGFISAIRETKSVRRDYSVVDDTVLVQLNPESTRIDFSDPIQVASGRVETDKDGIRQMNLLFSQGTDANLEMPDGTLIPTEEINVRVTELTVGDLGPERMPGPLPPSSAYTYAVSFDTDEALRAGAISVHFSKPVIGYVDNFLNFPVGVIRPVGVLNEQQARWEAIENGVVVRILEVSDGRAVLDLTGDGQPASSSDLESAGITDLELEQLAEIYQPGVSLWRLIFRHFSKIDGNDAQSPQNPSAEGKDEDDGGSPSDGNEPNSCNDSKQGGSSVIGIETQTLLEHYQPVGSPVSLHYHSGRSSGRGTKVTIPLTGPTLPEDLVTVRLEISIAGRRVRKTFEPEPNLVYEFVWDGKDRFGRDLTGTTDAFISIGYGYPALYRIPSEFGGFELATAEELNLPPTRFPFIFWTREEIPLTRWNVEGLKLGGWVPAPLHVYDANSLDDRTVFMGKGRWQSSSDIVRAATLETVAGNGEQDFSGDNGSALAAAIDRPRDIAFDSAGNLYIADTLNDRIRRIDKESGIITTVAGNGEECNRFNRRVNFPECGDGGAATEASLNGPSSIAFDKDDNLYVLDAGLGSLRRVDQSGRISTIAGDTERRTECSSADGVFFPNCGDDGPASQAKLATRAAFGGVKITVDDGGYIYLPSPRTNTVRRITPTGKIERIAGVPNVRRGNQDNSELDGSLATTVPLESPQSVYVNGDGKIYIVESGLFAGLKVMEANGRITRTVDLESLLVGENIQIIEDITFDRRGNMYLLFANGQRVYKIAPDNTVSIAIGSRREEVLPRGGFDGDGLPAANTRIRTNSFRFHGGGIDFGPDGRLYLADRFNNRIRRVSIPFPDIGEEVNQFIASENGREVYEFDPNGRHLRTFDANLGNVLYSFTYNDQGYLTAIIGSEGNASRTTRFERDDSDDLVAIIAPTGERTTVELNSDGYVTKFTSPSGRSYNLTYRAGGLLTSQIDLEGELSQYEYDEAGDLIQTLSPDGKQWNLSSVETPNSTTVTMQSATGRQRVYTVTEREDGVRDWETVYEDGTRSRRETFPDGVERYTYPNGIVETITRQPDPRFGLQAPLLNVTREYPSGLTEERSSSSIAPSFEPNQNSQIGAARTLTIQQNQDSFVTTFDPATRISTLTSPEGRVTSTEVDENGRIISYKTPESQFPSRTIFRGDGLQGRLEQGTGEQARVIEYLYDDQERVSGIRNSDGSLVRFEYDQDDRLIRHTRADGVVISIGYDENGRKVSQQIGERSPYQFTYNSKGRRDSFTFPGPEQATYRNFFNSERELERVELPNGDVELYNYDTGGKVVTETTRDGVRRYTYDTISGNLLNVATPAGNSVSYEYDGDLETLKRWQGEVEGSVSYTYNSELLLSSDQVNDETPISYSFDRDGLIIGAGPVSISREPESGDITGVEIGNLTTSYTFNGFGEVTQVNVQVDDIDLFNQEYEYNKAGKIFRLSESVTGEGSRTVEYSYDLLGQLSEIADSSSSTTAFSFDVNRNILTETRDQESSITSAVDERDRLIGRGTEEFEYNILGQLTSRIVDGQTTEYAYAATGSLAEVRLPSGVNISYTYDGVDRRIGRQVNGVLQTGYLYTDGPAPIAELSSDGAVRSRFIYATSRTVPEAMLRDGTIFVFITDQVGSVRLVVNSQTGEIAQRLSYDVYGNVVSDSSPGFQPFGFAGGLYDTDTKLYHFGARDYDPTLKRWLTVDPLLLAGKSTNLYTYVGNDPVNFRDPAGLAPIGVGGDRVGAAQTRKAFRGAFKESGAGKSATAEFGLQAEQKTNDFLKLKNGSTTPQKLALKEAFRLVGRTAPDGAAGFKQRSVSGFLIAAVSGPAEVAIAFGSIVGDSIESFVAPTLQSASDAMGDALDSLGDYVPSFGDNSNPRNDNGNSNVGGGGC